MQSELYSSLEAKIKQEVEDGLAVVNVEGKGRGVVSTRPFTRGDFICEYAGEYVCQREATRRDEAYSKDTNIGSYMFYFEHKGLKWW